MIIFAMFSVKMRKFRMFNLKIFDLGTTKLWIQRFRLLGSLTRSAKICMFSQSGTGQKPTGKLES